MQYLKREGNQDKVRTILWVQLNNKIKKNKHARCCFSLLAQSSELVQN